MRKRKTMVYRGRKYVLYGTTDDGEPAALMVARACKDNGALTVTTSRNLPMSETKRHYIWVNPDWIKQPKYSPKNT